MLPDNRISDQKSVGLRLRIVVWLWAPKLGYRDGLGTKLLSCLHTGLNSLMWSLTDCYKNGHKADLIDEHAYPSRSSDEADMKIHINGIQLCTATESTPFVYIVLCQ